MLLWFMSPLSSCGPPLSFISARYTWEELSVNVPEDAPQVLKGLQDSPRFREKYGMFREDLAHGAFMLLYNICTDGVSPFAKKFRSNYGVWPVFLELINTLYPHEVILVGLIGGPKSPKDFELYLQEICKELERLRLKGTHLMKVIP
jgi:hypothetical protein